MEDKLSEIIRILFRHVSVKDVLDEEVYCDAFDENLFEQLGLSYMKNYSSTEISSFLEFYQNLFYEKKQLQAGYKGEISGSFNVFDTIFYYVSKVLEVRDNEILCRYNKLLQWRMLTLEFSEEILIAAYYAIKRQPDEMTGLRLAWKVTIGHNNFYLKRIMERGLSENHFHLWGSAPIFQLSWISLMNNIENSSFVQALEKYDHNRRYRHESYEGGYYEFPLSTQHLQAALIRMFLYTWLTETDIRFGSYTLDYGDMAGVFSLRHSSVKACADTQICVADIRDIFNGDENSGKRAEEMLKPHKVDSRCKYLLGSIYLILHDHKFFLSNFSDIQSEYITLDELFHLLLRVKKNVDLEEMKPFVSTECYRRLWREKTLKNVKAIVKDPELLPDHVQDIQDTIASLKDKDIPDYALSGERLNTSALGDYAIFAGERWFLYQMFYKISRYRKNERELYNLFYAYILLRENIRSELLQSNVENVGFDNFQAYQSRKAELIDEHIFKREAARLAVRNCLFSGAINSLEIRIKPESTASANRVTIQKLDTMIGEAPRGKYYYYVVHFFKQSDDLRLNNDIIYCRHYALRKKNKKLGAAILDMREKYPSTARRILGIDAAGQELVCRPEVFAPVFRALRAHTTIVYEPEKIYSLPQLRVTYHAGEDFLDIVDGLRAIDEAMKYLNLECGDRLGHAIALGIDPYAWYHSKNNQLILSKQDYLDNIAWLYYALVQYNIKDSDNLKDYLRREFSLIFDDIYRQNLSVDELNYIRRMAENDRHTIRTLPDVENVAFDIHTYYQAWRLRGDDPALYIYGYYSEPEYTDYISGFRMNERYDSAHNSRQNLAVTYLYYSYHYNKKVRVAGNNKYLFKVPDMYIVGVALVQHKLRQKIARLGIGIETNPSSNFLISTFKDYSKHPILNFYNKGLAVSPEDLSKCSQISVSINTDDLGVFSTSLENEYALMAQSLENVVDSDGDFMYNQSMIYDWIDNVRIMGNEQVFGRPEMPEKE